MDFDQNTECFISSLEDLIINSLRKIDHCLTDPSKPSTTFADVVEDVSKLKDDDKSNLQELQAKVTDLQIIHENTKQLLSKFEKEREKLKGERKCLKDQKDRKTTHLKKVSKDCENRKRTVESLEKDLSKNSENLQRLNRAKGELLLYQQLTGIQWDFTAPSNVVKGFVTNKETSFLKPFSFDKEKRTISQITESLWDLIDLSSMKS